MYLTHICPICEKYYERDCTPEPSQICDECQHSLSLCPKCYCMTYTVKGYCGKCKGLKNE